MHSSPAIVESYHPGGRSGHAGPAQGRPKTGSDRKIHGRKKRWGRLLYRRRSTRRRSFPASSPVDGSAGVREGGRGFGGFALGQDEEEGKSSGCAQARLEGETEKATGFVIQPVLAAFKSVFLSQQININQTYQFRNRTTNKLINQNHGRETRRAAISG